MRRDMLSLVLQSVWVSSTELGEHCHPGQQTWTMMTSNSMNNTGHDMSMSLSIISATGARVCVCVCVLCCALCVLCVCFVCVYALCVCDVGVPHHARVHHVIFATLIFANTDAHNNPTQRYPINDVIPDHQIT